VSCVPIPIKPQKLRRPHPSGFNPDLRDLWRLLNCASGQLHYAIDTVAPLERIAGPEVAQGVLQGLVAHWRNSAPLLRSQRIAGERNSINWAGLMAFTGVTLEATTVRGWAENLTSIEAMRAAGYATLEINGFPRWLSNLVAAKPAELRTVLLAEIVEEITRTETDYRDTLQNAARADDQTADLLAPVLLDAATRLETRRLLNSSRRHGTAGHLLTIAPNGNVRASVKAKEIEVLGPLQGNVEGADKIYIRNGARFVGDLHALGLVIEDGVFICGKVDPSRPSCVIA